MGEPTADGGGMEEVFDQVGAWGRFQWLMLVCNKYGFVPISWNLMIMAFAGLVPDWWCLPGQHAHQANLSSFSATGVYTGNWSRDNETFHACEIPGSKGQSCEGHVVFENTFATVISEMIGVLVGAIVGGLSSDTFGRRITMYVTILCHTILTLAAAFSVTWEMFIVMRVLIGMTVGVFTVSGFPYPMEFVSPKQRQFTAFIPGYHIGVSLFALVAWQFPNWKHLHIGASLLGVPFLLTWFLGTMPESPRWLATQGRLQEAERVVERIARVNRRPVPGARTRRVLENVARAQKEAGQGRRYTYLDVYRGWRIARTTLILQCIWFSESFSYFGITFGVSALSGNLFLNIFLMAAVEIPFHLSTVCLSNTLGRRWTGVMYFSLCALCCFGILIVNKTVGVDEHRGTIITVLAVGTVVSLGAAMLAVRVLTTEQYPTVIRNLGFGASNIVARVGAASAPVLLKMDTEQDVVRAYVIIGSLMVASGLGTLLLRETKGQSLQDTIATDIKDTEVGKVKDSAGPGGEGHRDQTRSLGEKSPVWTVNGERMKNNAQSSSSEKLSVKL
ncbi:solute carrier family 22 member 7-like [Babylonia areolata]|uniref:solute carrier family 22 member 7-like n=1 Tax=Babylonia areolata TaxID=304850 RepID=UPI003FD5B9AC